MLREFNHRLFSGDNGRVLGYDNAHGFRHRHWYGDIVPVEFASFESIEECFADDLIELLQEAGK